MSEVCVTSVTRGHSVPWMVQGYTAAHSLLQICPQSAQRQIKSGGACRRGCGTSEVSIVSIVSIISTISTTSPGRDLDLDMRSVPRPRLRRQRLTCMQTLQTDTAHLSHISDVRPDDGSKSSYYKQLAAGC